MDMQHFIKCLLNYILHAHARTHARAHTHTETTVWEKPAVGMKSSSDATNVSLQASAASQGQQYALKSITSALNNDLNCKKCSINTVSGNFTLNSVNTETFVCSLNFVLTASLR